MSIVLDGTNGITAANVYGRNLIINGSGRINQRVYTSGAATSGANEYTLDRWRVVTSGQSLTFTGTNAGRVMTAPAGGAEQVIEGANIAGGTYVLNWTGTATATVDGNAVAKGGTFTLTANTNATVRFTGGTFSEVQVEAGSVATPFEHRSIGEELALCQRYFCKTFDQGTAPAQNAGGNGALVGYSSVSNASFGVCWWYPVTMRAVPTVTTFAPDAASSDWSDQGGARPTASVTSNGQTNVGVRATGSILAGGFYTIQLTASAEL